MKIMIQERYQKMASELIRSVFPKNPAFIFGGAARKKKYGDVDIAIQSVKNSEKILKLYDIFEDSNFPKTVDIIHFDNADTSFREYVLTSEKKIWM